jgi:hypothetical protein
MTRSNLTFKVYLHAQKRNMSNIVKARFFTTSFRMLIGQKFDNYCNVIKQSAVTAYQIQTQSPEKVSHLEAKIITGKFETFSGDWV